MLAITVDTPLDVVDAVDNLTSLREAINFANITPGADAIDFDASLSGATIHLDGTELEITETLTIDASAIDEPVNINANEQSRVLNFTANSGDLTLNSLSIYGGKTTADNVNFPDSTQSGAGIRFVSNGKLAVTNSIVSGNSTNGALAPGGGIFTDSGNVTLTSSIVSGNSTNQRYGDGGGISTDSGNVTLTGSIVSGNSTMGSNGDGGGISTVSGAVTLIDSAVIENTSNDDGGGILTVSGAVTLIDSVVLENTSYDDGSTQYGSTTNRGGGGIFTGSGAVTLTGSTISGNSTMGSFANGGGIYTDSGDVSLTDSSISWNTTNSDGGGIFSVHGSIVLIGSTVFSNTSGDDGGGIHTQAATPTGTITLVRSTVSENHAKSGGGGIWNFGGTVVLSNSTITRNSADRGGGFYILSSSSTNETPTVVNSIIAGNLAGVSAPDVRLLGSGSTLAIDYSLIGNTSGSGITATTGVGNLFDVDPLLGPLADNGGPTQTHALLFGSPAIDAGNSTLLTDQRGLTRPIDFFSVQNVSGSNGSDVGAFELQTLTDDFVLPTDVVVLAETASNLDLSTALLIEEDTATPIVTLSASTGMFSAPADGSAVGAGVTAILVDPQTITLTGAAIDINTYFDSPSNLVYTSASGIIGDNAATITVTVDDGLGVTNVGAINVDILEQGALLVTTEDDAVDSFDGKTSLREATNFANSQVGADTITFDISLSGTTVQLSNMELEITETLTIDALTLDHSIIISANQQSRVLNFTATSGDLTLRNLTITDGHTTGSNASGGGIRFDSNSTSTLALEQSIVQGNTSEGNGGGIYTGSGAVTLKNSTVSGNIAGIKGGGIWTYSGDITLTESNFSGNSSYGDGGGIFTDSGAVTLTASTVSGNSTEGSPFSGNTSAASGADGGGIFTNSGTVTVTSSTVTGNNTVGLGADGGGIFTISGAVTVTNSTVTGNNTVGSGADGGGIFTIGGAVTVTSSTVSGNSARGGGGGVQVLFNSGSPHFTIENSIVAGNFQNTDINGHDGTPSDLVPDPGSTLTINHSLIGVADGLTITGNLGNQTGTAVSPLDPLLGPLADNGGPTPTHALLPGSQALNSGNPSIPFIASESDQRGIGYSRVAFDRIDMGSFEAHTTPSANFDQDDDVDGADFLAWQRGFGKTNAIRTDGNSDDDTDVDASDLAAWLVSFGQVQPQSLATAASDDLSAVNSRQMLLPPATPPQVATTFSNNAELINSAMAMELLSVATQDELFVADETLATKEKTFDLAFAAGVDIPAISAGVEDSFGGDENEAESSETEWLKEELLERVFG